MKKLLILITLYVGSRAIVLAQTTEDPDMQQIIDDIAASLDEAVAPERVYENLMLVMNDPYDLNSVSREELQMLHFLSDQQIQDFLAYREQQKKIISIYELQVITSLDEQTLKRLQHFVTVNELTATVDRSLIGRIVGNKQNYTLVRFDRTLEEKTGYQASTPDEKRFMGSPDRWLMRYRNSRPGDFSIGFAMEKDAGERFSWETSPTGFDYSSFHVQILNKKRLRNLIIGDFQVQAGQGLVLGGLFGLGKGGETITSIRKSTLGGLPYTSTTENMNLRGALTTLSLSKRLQLTSYASIAKRDASISADSLEGHTATGLPTSGLHRNASEMRTRKSLTEYNAATMLEYNTSSFRAGAILNYIEFSEPIAKRPTRYNQFHFRDLLNINASGWFQYTRQNISVFSEFAQSIGNGNAWVCGLLASLTPQLDLSLLYRNYDRDFHTFHANAFGESASVRNETGIYCGWKYRWNKRYSFAGYVDMFRFPWLRYRVYAPSTGYEWLLRLNLQPARTLSAYIQVKEERKGRNVTDTGLSTYPVATTTRRNYLAQLTVEAGSGFTLRSRIQFSEFRFNGRLSSGMVVAQDIKYSAGRFTVAARYALFDTDNYDNRQYVYENDVHLSFSMPAYDGKGVRKYILLKYALSRRFTFWFRLAHTRYVDRDTIGSGYDTILGNTRNDIKFQLRFRM